MDKRDTAWLPFSEEVSELKNLRTQLFIVSVSVATAVGAALAALAPFSGNVRGLHDGEY